MLVTTQPQNTDGLAYAQQLVAEDFQKVNDLIQQSLDSNVALIGQLGHYIINSGGKRLRPLLVLLSAKAAGYTGREHIDIAAIIEFIHTATLLHDDVVDASEMRRGKDTANKIWGNEASVLVGDFLYSRSFQMMVKVDNMRIMQILSDATNTIAEGEVMQLLYCREPDTTEEQYLNVIYCKTAKLFEAGCQLGAVLAGTDAETERQMLEFGKHLGTAFQIIDDVLDYSGNAETTGKNIGDDLAEGKPTLPLIYAMHQGNAEQTETIRNAIKNGGANQIQQVTAAVQSTNALDYAAQTARQEFIKASTHLGILPDSPYKDALASLAKFSIERSF